VVGTKLSTLSKQSNRLGRPNYPRELKLRLAQQACEPGVSVSKLALEHGINANLVFKWRRYYLAGEFDIQTKPDLLPVAIVLEDGTAAPAQQSSAEAVPVVATATPAVGTGNKIEVQFADALVRIGSGADVALLQTVLAVLRS
jgi:transposase